MYEIPHKMHNFYCNNMIHMCSKRVHQAVSQLLLYVVISHIISSYHHTEIGKIKRK